MKQRIGNRVLLWAFGLSVLAHLIFALVAHSARVEAAPAQTPVPMQIIHVAMATPAPTPTPQPAKPSHQEHAPTARAPRAHVVLPHVGNSGADPHSGPVVVATAGTDTPGVSGATDPSPAPPPRPACAAPNVPAHTIDARMPETPDGVAGLPATAQVQVTLDAAGHVTDARIYHSAEDQQLDRAALLAARGSSYAAAIVDCLPTGGTYLFTVEFED